MKNRKTNNEVIHNREETTELVSSCVIKVDSKEEVTTSNLVVQVKDVYFTYEKPKNDKFVLNGLTIHALKGEIYALLGPSGCGKTTILNCITGLLTPYRGQINIPLNKNPNTKVPGLGVGYMPQELSLFPNLTIGETLWLFGSICGVSRATLTDKIEKFTHEFELPPTYRLIGTLSGGQKRRVSLLAAVVHEPALLILDEPTVGIDPILRKTIWTYLHQLSNQGKTIIITTHYIDEAKDANTVGLMRDGKLLAELSPTALLNKFNETSLEKCFYRLCVKKDEDGIHLNDEQLFCRNIKEPLVPNKPIENGVKLKRALPNTSFFEKRKEWKNIYSLMNKNFKLLKRSWLQMFLQFFLPGTTVIMFGLCIGGTIYDVNIAVVNQEDPIDLSEIYLKHLSDHPFIQNFYPTMAEGIRAVENGESVLAVTIPPDFSKCFLIKNHLGIHVDNKTYECSTVHVFADKTNQIISLHAEHMVFKSFQSFQREILQSGYFDANPRLANLPITFDKPIYGNMDMIYSEYITSAILLVCIHFLACSLTGMSLLLERDSGVLERLEAVGVTKTEIFSSQMFTNVIVVLVQVTLMLSAQFMGFNTTLEGSIVDVILLIILQGLCGMLFGFFVSSISPDIVTGIFGGMGAFFTTLILCGFIWPVEGMPYVLQWIATFAPVTLTNEALRSVLTRGWDIRYQQVWLGYISVIAWSVVFLVLALLRFRRKN